MSKKIKIKLFAIYLNTSKADTVGFDVFCKLSVQIRPSESHFTANEVDVAATYTVENVVGKLDYEHVGMRLAHHSLVVLYFVAATVELDVNAVTEQIFNDSLGIFYFN